MLEVKPNQDSMQKSSTATPSTKQNHDKAADLHNKASNSHKEASKSCDSNDMKSAEQHSKTAQGHADQANIEGAEISKKYAGAQTGMKT